jgi:hypothetical protein
MRQDNTKVRYWRLIPLALKVGAIACKALPLKGIVGGGVKQGIPGTIFLMAEKEEAGARFKPEKTAGRNLAQDALVNERRVSRSSHRLSNDGFVGVNS